jgi:hypothetical protein
VELKEKVGPWLGVIFQKNLSFLMALLRRNTDSDDQRIFQTHIDFDWAFYVLLGHP